MGWTHFYGEETTPLGEAAKKGELDKVKAIVKKDPDAVNQPDPEGRTALCWAAGNGEREVVEYLLDNGAYINRPNFRINHITALSLACAMGRDAVVKLLLERGADATQLEADGRTVLHCVCASMSGNAKVLRLLLDHDQDIPLNAQTKRGETVVFLACERGHAKLLRMLLEAGANAMMPIKKGTTPARAAKKEGYDACLDVLWELAPLSIPYKSWSKEMEERVGKRNSKRAREGTEGATRKKKQKKEE